MATYTIFALTAATSFVGTDEFEFQLASGGLSKKVTGENIRKQLFAGGTGFTASDPLTCGILTASGLVDLSGAAAGQVKFPATQNASSDANTLDDYEEGSWTPSDQSGAGLTLTVTDAKYVKIGKMVYARLRITYPVTASGSSAKIGGLPYTAATDSGTGTSGVLFTVTDVNIAFLGLVLSNTTNFQMFKLDGNAITNTNMSTKTIAGIAIYEASA